MNCFWLSYVPRIYNPRILVAVSHRVISICLSSILLSGLVSGGNSQLCFGTVGKCYDYVYSDILNLVSGASSDRPRASGLCIGWPEHTHTVKWSTKHLVVAWSIPVKTKFDSAWQTVSAWSKITTWQQPLKPKPRTGSRHSRFCRFRKRRLLLRLMYHGTIGRDYTNHLVTTNVLIKKVTQWNWYFY